MPASKRVEIRSQVRRFDGFFKLDEYIVAHERQDGTMSPDLDRLVFERGDAAVVLLFDRDKNAAVLVEQFRIPVLIGRRRDDPATRDGWLTEPVAGMIDAGDTPASAAIRETMEETGYRIRDPKLIGTYFSSPGACSERYFLYYAEVSEADRTGTGGGVDDEDIRILYVPVDELIDRAVHGLIDDPKIVIGAYWLRDYLQRKA
jgi:nudix-type nucleoside diphosphatase (YffH/AdpP family)